MDLIDFELTTIAAGPPPNRRARRRGMAGAHQCTIKCRACGDKATARDPRLARAAASVHAKTAHAGAAARVLPMPGPTA